MLGTQQKEKPRGRLNMTKRVSFELDGPDLLKLLWLSGKFNARSKADVMRESLSLFHFLKKKNLEGFEITLTRWDKKIIINMKGNHHEINEC